MGTAGWHATIGVTIVTGIVALRAGMSWEAPRPSEILLAKRTANAHSCLVNTPFSQRKATRRDQSHDPSQHNRSPKK
jgi:hypothetical protein